jgi:hypothetical protein
MSDEKESLLYQPTFINEVSNHDEDVWWQASATLMHTFPMIRSPINVLM